MVNINVDVKNLGDVLDIGRYALGQGGFADVPMFEVHTRELKNLNIKYIRVFILEFFNIYLAHNRFFWEKLDKMIKAITDAGAEPILCLCLKPKVLYPKIDHKVVHPKSYKEWEKIIFEIVKHCKKLGVKYWEFLNEPDAGEWGGAPFHTTPEEYSIFYEHTVRAIKKADRTAKVGGPAVSNKGFYESSIIPYFLKYCSKKNVPLDFVTWHKYSTDPMEIVKSIKVVKEEVKKYPNLKCKIGITEWSVSFSKDYMKFDKNPDYVPCFIIETIFGMIEEGLDFCAYYHIRNINFTEKIFSNFISKNVLRTFGEANYSFTHLALFDFHGNLRPAFFAFKMLSKLWGRRIVLPNFFGNVKALAAYDEYFNMVNLLIWNFAVNTPRKEIVNINVSNLRKSKWTRYTRYLLNTKTESNEEDRRLCIVNRWQKENVNNIKDSFEINPYGITLINIKGDV